MAKNLLIDKMIDIDPKKITKIKLYPKNILIEVTFKQNLTVQYTTEYDAEFLERLVREAYG